MRKEAAQRSRESLIKGKGKLRHVDPEVEMKDVTAYCAAETYNMHVARDLLRKAGWREDPRGTGLFPKVLHVQGVRATHAPGGEEREEREEGRGDVFVLPSGSMVTWDVSEKAAHHLVEKVLTPAAGNSHVDRLEAEDLEYIEDPTSETSELIGEDIILGTKAVSPTPTPSDTPQDSATHHPHHRHEADPILAKIAFSSALARSTKLAVLEETLSHYFHIIPSLLTSRSADHITSTFILRKTGELLHIRAQLNLYSELTDSLPDLFWNSPHELGLQSYYDALSSALDVRVRIKVLNEKMDYASEIARVLRERLSEKHSHMLEWIIIWLIMVEVAYGSWHLYWEHVEARDPLSERNLLREYLLRELGREGTGK